MDRRPVLAVEELAAGHREAERLVVRKEGGNAIDVAVPDAAPEAEADDGRDQSRRCRAATPRLPDDELGADGDAVGMVRRLPHPVELLEVAEVTFASEIDAERADRLPVLDGDEGVAEVVERIGNRPLLVIGVG